MCVSVLQQHTTLRINTCVETNIYITDNRGCPLAQIRITRTLVYGVSLEVAAAFEMENEARGELNY